jgi:hypothetical protein
MRVISGWIHPWMICRSLRLKNREGCGIPGIPII